MTSTPKENTMRRTALALTLMAAIVAAPMTATTSAQSRKDDGGMTIPVAGQTSTGDKFAGTLSILRFVNSGGRVVAVGTIAGTMTNPNGQTIGSAFQTVTLPVNVNNSGTTGATASAV